MIPLTTTKIRRHTVPMPQSKSALAHTSSHTLAEIASTWSKKLPDPFIRNSFKAFEGNDHRLEFVANINGISYINDSKATNINSTWYAIGDFSDPVILISGGNMEQGENFDRLRKIIRERVNILIFFGEIKEEIEETFLSLTELIQVSSVEEAVHVACQVAQNHDVVLFSPGCRSKKYRNYRERGNVFKKAVFAYEKRKL